MTTSSTTTVLFIRHGTTPTTGKVLPGRAAGLHLAEAGIRQAQAVADSIGALGRVSAVYASPLERTRQTAAPIAKACKLRVRRDAGLLECDFGEWTGSSLKRLAKLPEWQTVQRAPSQFRFPGGESFAEMQARITGAVARLCHIHPGEVIVAVSHADPIKAAVASALGTPLDLFQRISIAPCSISVVRYCPLGPSVGAVNTSGNNLSTLI